MQYIRDKRALPDYNPNHRHCMVGQDADLIMLALATHEPHFILLREVIDFNQNMRFGSARQTVMRQTKECQFQLLHLSVLREYVELDLSMPIKNSRDTPEQAIARVAAWTPKKLDRERLIDDFILLTFLVGNDFLPHLPTLDIGEHAFDTIFNAYKTSLVCHDFDYLVEKGELRNFAQLEKVFSLIGEQEAEILGNRDEDTKEFARRKALRMKKNSGRGSKLVDTSLEEAEEAEEAAERAYREALEEAGDVAFTTRIGAEESKEEEEEEVAVEEEEEEGVTHLYDAMATTSSATTKDYRGRYYFEKFKILPKQVVASGFMDDLKERYLEGLIWCLAYYTKGCISWNWYFPYHYGPMLIDMTNLTEVCDRIKFDLGQPFRPFQQLLGCLPPLSMKLLPRKYQWLMTADNSPVLDSYPSEFGIDQNGKKNPWEAVVLLPFIDEKKLLEAERIHCPESSLSASEKARNSFGKVLYHKYNPSIVTTYFSCNAEIGLEDIRSCQSEVNATFPSLAPSLAFKQELIPGTVVPFPGYPSLTILPMASSDIEAMKINVFGGASKYRSIVLEIDSSSSVLSMDTTENVQAMEDKLINLIGKKVFVNYPLIHEAKVVAITTEFSEYRSVDALPTTLTLPAFIAECEALYAAKQLANNRKYFSRDMTGMEADKDDGVVFPSTVGLVKGDSVLRIPHDDDSKVKWLAEAEAEREKYVTGRGIPGSGGLQIGGVQVRVLVQALQGLRRDPATGATSKVYGTSEADIPIQLMLLHTSVDDPRFRESSEVPVEKLVPIGSTVVVSAGKYAGNKGTVVGPHGKGKAAVSSDKRVVDVEFTEMAPEPPFAYALADAVTDHYYSSKEVCSVLGITPSVMGSLVGNVTVQVVGGDSFDKVNIGLDLKRNGQHQLLGYVRRRVTASSDGSKSTALTQNVWANGNSVTILGAGDGVAAAPAGGRGKPGASKSAGPSEREDGEIAYWEYTLRTVAVLVDYKNMFPEVFQSLTRLDHEKCYTARQIFAGAENPGQRLQDVLAWMKTQPVTSLPRTPFSTEALSR